MLDDVRVPPGRSERRPLRGDDAVAVSFGDDDTRGDVQVRARGGACVAGVPCALLFRTSMREAHVFWRRTPNDRVETTFGSDIAAARAIVDGPDPVIEIQLRRTRGHSGWSPVRVPMVLGVPGVELLGLPVERGRRPRLLVHDRSEPGVIVDAFRSDRWTKTAFVVPAADGRASLPFELEPGLWRLQIHRDPLRGKAAGVHLIYIAPPQASIREATYAACDALSGLGRAHVQLACATERVGHADVERMMAALKYDFAGEERRLLRLPPARSNRAAQLRRVNSTRRTVQVLALSAMGLQIILFIGLLFREERRSARVEDHVREVSRDLSVTEAAPLAARRSLWILLTALVALGFAVAALLVYLRFAPAVLPV